MNSLEDYQKETENFKSNITSLLKERGMAVIKEKVIYFKKQQLSIKKDFNDLLKQLPHSFPELSNRYFKKQNKAGEIGLFGLNSHQLYLHKRLCEIHNKYGYIEGLIVKCRQNGISTYQSEFGFAYNLAYKQNQYFLTNDSDNASTLFDKFNLVYSNLPFFLKEEERGLKTGHYIKFKNNGIFFKTTDAGKGHRTSPTRGKTYGCLFDDEAGHRLKGEDTTGLIRGNNRVHLIVGTPTAGSFLESVYETLKKNNELDKVIFLNWLEFEEYSKKPEEGWYPSNETLEYLKKFKLESIALNKVRFLEWQIGEYEKEKVFNPYYKFSEEYPSTVEAGFELRSDNCFCDPYFIQLAAQNRMAIQTKNVIIGIDVAAGGDKTVMCLRFGNVAEFFELRHNAGSYSHLEAKAVEAVNIIVSFIRKSYIIDFINVDATNDMGREFVVALKRHIKNYNFHIPTYEVHFASKVEFHSNYELKKRGIKEEMYFNLRSWLVSSIVSIKNEICIKELLATKIISRNGEELLVKKEKIIEDLRHSPDYADALALTFAKKESLSFEFEMRTTER